MKNFLNIDKDKDKDNPELFISAKYTILIGWALLLSVLFPTVGLVVLSLITVAYMYQLYFPRQIN